MLDTIGYCPDHTGSLWRVEEAFDGDRTLAVITDGDGMGVWELGVRPGDAGFEEMRDLAGTLCEEHNGTLLEAGTEPLAGDASIARGFAEDRSGSAWTYGCTVLGGIPMGAVFAAIPEGEVVAALLGPGLCPAEGMGLTAKRMVALHNTLLEEAS